MADAREFDRLWIWDEPGSERLAWYRAVAANRKPAKFRIARRVPVSVDLERDGEDALRAELDRRTPEFLDLWRAIREGRAELPSGPTPRGAEATRACSRWRGDEAGGAEGAKPRASLLDLCRELARRMLAHCNFCRWDCGVDRASGNGRLGTCKLASDSRVSSYFHHPGEELVYRGTRGSGTIFFTSCNMRCSFCQNGDISTDKDNGAVVDARTLATMAWLLRIEGCHNVNWVGGEVTIHLHTIVEAISLLDEIRPSAQDLRRALREKHDTFRTFPAEPAGALHQGEWNAPMLWNSNFFMSEPAMRILRILMDVWLPDFKFGPGPCGIALSRTPWYWETVTGNLRKIQDWGEDATIRHLVMPEHVDCCTKPCLEWIAANMPDVPVNVMDQYRPDNFCDPGSPKFQEKYIRIARRPRRDEVLRAFEIAKELGLRFEGLSYEKSTMGLTLA